MDNRCPECGSEDIIEGKLNGAYGVVFIPENESGLIKKSSYIKADACRKCGAVFGLKLTDKPNKLTE
ncbi:MAG: hypothetical protein IJ555_06420 [Ruminococcus sp.]|nr:hypothetical protein [Ruminococcus sp.]MBR1751069.1 hypothetical protein [Ruminococcus sp.]